VPCLGIESWIQIGKTPVVKPLENLKLGNLLSPKP
jgi:hypothetical protein